MTELELKLAVPPAARDAVRAAVATASAHVLPLAAAYADTDDQRLAAAGFALRLRREGARCVQALKGRGDGLLRRLEHEVEVPAGSRLDPARHAGTPAGDALQALLAGAPLHEQYRTDIRRTLRRTRHHGARIELAFDEGEIVAGTRRLPVCELELELIDGPPAALAALALRWARRHGLVWDTRTKSERGHRLALGLDRPRVLPPPAQATPQALLQHALACAAECAYDPADPAARQALAQAQAALGLPAIDGAAASVAWLQRLAQLLD